MPFARPAHGGRGLVPAGGLVHTGGGGGVAGQQGLDGLDDGEEPALQKSGGVQEAGSLLKNNSELLS